MNRMNDSGTRRGWSARRRLYRSGVFLAQGIQFPFEPINETSNWQMVDFACYASGAFWDALVRKPRVCGDAIWSLSNDSILDATKGLDQIALHNQLNVLRQQVSRTPGAYVVLGWLNIQIEKEVFYAMIGLIIDVIAAHEAPQTQEVRRARAG